MKVAAGIPETMLTTEAQKTFTSSFGGHGVVHLWGFVAGGPQWGFKVPGWEEEEPEGSWEKWGQEKSPTAHRRFGLGAAILRKFTGSHVGFREQSRPKGRTRNQALSIVLSCTRRRRGQDPPC